MKRLNLSSLVLAAILAVVAFAAVGRVVGTYDYTEIPNLEVGYSEATGAAGNLRVGNGTPGVSLNGEDAYVEGTFEVDGAAQFDGGATVNGAVTVTPLAAGLFNILTGNLKVGNGAPTTAQDGEDAYVEGFFENDGGARFDGDLAINSTITRTGQVYTFTNMKVSNASGTDWVITDDTQKATLAASQTSETMIIGITGLHAGDIITKVNLLGQVESAGGAVVIDADLHEITSVAADLTDTVVGSIVRPTVTADTALNSTATHGVSGTLAVTVAAGTTYYVKVTGTTAASTDIALQGVQLTITQK